MPMIGGFSVKHSLFKSILLMLCFVLFSTPFVRAEENQDDELRSENLRSGELRSETAADDATQPEEQKVKIAADDALPDVTARSAIVIEASTGHVLYSRNKDARMFPASTTKMMTLIMALEYGHLSELVKVSSNAAGTEGSTLWLEEDEKLHLIDLLYGMMMISGNDATVAVAEHIAGSVPAFARKMTDRAHELGATSTNFMNSSGLPDEKHYTTAHDLAILAAHGYTLNNFEKIVSTKEGRFSWVHDPSHFLRNENQMLWLYDGANGIKTGYTDAAGRCLVSAAKRDGIQLIAVVLDADFMWNDSIALLDEGFRHIKSKKIIKADSVGQTVPVVSGRRKTVEVNTQENVSLPEFDDAELEYELEYELPDHVRAPIAKGDVIGTMHVMLDGREVAKAPMVATEDVEQKSFFKLLCSKVKNFFGGVF